MAGGIDWFRWHHGSVTDPKFQLVAKKAEARFGDVMAVWAFVLEKASADQDRGAIGPLDFETLDYLLGAEAGTASRILEAMTARGLIVGNRVAKWEERQPKREREDANAADRKRAQREREASQSQPEEANQSQDEPCHATSRQKKPRGEERRVDAEAKASAGRRSRACPPDFSPVNPEGWIAQNCPGLDWRLETEKFRDHEFSVPKQDWLKAWRNWMRRAHVKPTSYRQQDANAAAARVAEMTGGLASAKRTEVFDAPRLVG